MRLKKEVIDYIVEQSKLSKLTLRHFLECMHLEMSDFVDETRTDQQKVDPFDFPQKPGWGE